MAATRQHLQLDIEPVSSYKTSSDAMPAQALADRLDVVRRSPGLSSFLPPGLRAIASSGRGRCRPTADDDEESWEEPPRDGGSETSSGCCWASADELCTGRSPHGARRLAFDPSGCRQLQRLLEDAPDEVRSAVAAELRGRVGDAARSPHANHVVQKCVEVLPPAAFQFVIDELLVHATLPHLARHKFGCRIVQRLLEHGSDGQVSVLVEALMPSISALSRHAFGNYVVQCLIGRCSAEQRLRATEALRNDVASLCRDHYGSSVVRTILASGSTFEGTALATAILQSKGLVQDLARTRHGHMIIKLVVNWLEMSGRQLLMEDLAESKMQGLSGSRYGRSVLHRLGLCPTKSLAPCAVSGGA